MRAKIRLDTISDVRGFVEAVSCVSEPVILTDGNNFTVSAKSMLGAMYTMEWREVYCTCDKDIYRLVHKYILEE